MHCYSIANYIIKDLELIRNVTVEAQVGRVNRYLIYLVQSSINRFHKLYFSQQEYVITTYVHLYRYKNFSSSPI